MMCSNSEDLYEMANWAGKGTESRQKLIEKLQGKSVVVLDISGHMTKPTVLVSGEVRHKPACTVSANTEKLKISDLSRGGILLSVYKNKGTYQLCSYCTADLLLWFRKCRLLVF